MKVLLYEDERWPDISIHPAPDGYVVPKYPDESYVEIDQRTIDEWKSAKAAYDAIQEKLKDMVYKFHEEQRSKK